jgi:hypothetical protein
MKKIIKVQDFPIVMNKENVDILAEMMMAFPPLQEWRDISNLLDYDDRNLIRNRIREIKEIEEKRRWDSLTKEEQEEEKRKIEASLKEGPNVFRGNILQQEWDSIDLARIEKEKKKKEGQDESLE